MLPTILNILHAAESYVLMEEIYSKVEQMNRDGHWKHGGLLHIAIMKAVCQGIELGLIENRKECFKLNRSFHYPREEYYSFDHQLRVLSEDITTRGLYEVCAGMNALPVENSADDEQSSDPEDMRLTKPKKILRKRGNTTELIMPHAKHGRYATVTIAESEVKIEFG